MTKTQEDKAYENLGKLLSQGLDKAIKKDTKAIKLKMAKKQWKSIEEAICYYDNKYDHTAMYFCQNFDKWDKTDILLYKRLCKTSVYLTETINKNS